MDGSEHERASSIAPTSTLTHRMFPVRMKEVERRRYFNLIATKKRALLTLHQMLVVRHISEIVLLMRT